MVTGRETIETIHDINWKNFRQVATPGMRSAEKPISADGETSAR
jgi:hypothetical protein